MMTLQSVATPAGIRQVAALAGSIWREHFVPIIGAQQVEYMLEKFQSEDAISEQIYQGYHYYLMMTADGPAGYIAGIFRENELFLSKIYLQKTCRGKGYARQGIDFLCSLALARGITRVTLNVNKRNHASIFAYQKMGFSISGSIVTDIGDNFVMDDFVMEREIPFQQQH